jgi:hypothetical protein
MKETETINKRINLENTKVINVIYNKRERNETDESNAVETVNEILNRRAKVITR